MVLHRYPLGDGAIRASGGRRLEDGEVVVDAHRVEHGDGLIPKGMVFDCRHDVSELCSDLAW